MIGGKVDQTLADVVGDLGCGNGIVEGEERCDDGNVLDGDGCSSMCVAALVVCDDGNTIAGDG